MVLISFAYKDFLKKKRTQSALNKKKKIIFDVTIAYSLCLLKCGLLLG